MANEIEIDLLKELVDYDPQTGIVTWKPRPLKYFQHCNPAIRAQKTWNTRYAGNKVGTPHYRYNYHYLYTRILGTPLKVHRIAWALHYGEWPKNHIDHVNGDGSDNRICNLSSVDMEKNMKNKSRYSTNTTGYSGVTLQKNNRYKARISVNGNWVHLGVYYTLEEAVDARREAEIKYGYHENHGREQPNAEG